MIAATNPTITTSPPWRMCPMCWGQRRVFQDRNGEGLVPAPCGACLGIGEQLSALG